MNLKPCPFCGGGAKKESVWIHDHWGSYSGFGKQECSNCGGSISVSAPGFLSERICNDNGKGEKLAQDMLIEAWNKRASAWIPVSERLPEKKTLVMAWNGDWVIAFYQIEPLYPERCGWNTMQDSWPEDITHWQPLPDEL